MPKVVNGLQLTVHSSKKTVSSNCSSVNREPKTKYCNSRGFTLIELLIVISIIGILVATGTYSWGAAQIKARDNRRKTDIKAIQQALEVYYQTKGFYPPSNGSGSPYPGLWCAPIRNTSSEEIYQRVKNELEASFINKVPEDPVYKGDNFHNYYYRISSPGNYILLASLENSKDPEYLTTTDNFSGCAFYFNTNYHYRVTNP